MVQKTSSNTVRAFKDMARRCSVLSNEIGTTSKYISLEIANELADEMSDNYTNFINNKVQDDSQNRSDTHIFIESTNRGYHVGMRGHQVVYDEYGTGLNGMDNPHPEHDRRGMNPYASGKTIQYDKHGFPYWRYRGVSTYGVPAGMFIYDSFMNVAENKSKEIALENIKKVNKKVMKGK